MPLHRFVDATSVTNYDLAPFRDDRIETLGNRLCESLEGDGTGDEDRHGDFLVFLIVLLMLFSRARSVATMSDHAGGEVNIITRIRW
jgi:hypothetical protein